MVRLPLTLERPLACIDIEATGPRPETDRIIELAVVTMFSDGTRDTQQWLVNPGCPIPRDSTAVHGITDADVRGAPRFEEVAGDVAAALREADLCGFNLRAFDVPILRAEFARAGVPWPSEKARTVDAFVIFRDREPRSLSGAVRFYLRREHDGAHRAAADADATLDVLLAQLERYPDLPSDFPALDVASGGRQPDWATELGHIRWDDDGDAIVAFGRHKDARLVDMDEGFLRWMLRNDFPADARLVDMDEGFLRWMLRNDFPADVRLVDMDEGFLRWVLRNDFPADVHAIVRRVCRGERPRAPDAAPLPPEPEESDDPDDHWGDDDCDEDPRGVAAPAPAPAPNTDTDDTDDIPF